MRKKLKTFMLISNYYPLYKSPYKSCSSKNCSFSKTDNTGKDKLNKLSNYTDYNFVYYGINFTGAKLKTQMQRLKAEEFPSEDYYNYAKSVLSQNPDTQKTIFDIHAEFYEKLFNATSLEEAKAYYPELKDVIDAKDYVTMTNYEDLPYGIRKIYDGENNKITIENLTLELLKKVYGGLRDRRNPKNYYGLADHTIDKMLEALNIKKFSDHYSRAYRSCNPDNIDIMSKSKKKYFENPENIRKNAEAQRIAYEKHPERKEAASKRMKAQLSAMTPEEREAFEEKRIKALNSKETKEKMSQRSKQLWEDEEYRKKQQTYSAIRKEVWNNHPEIKAAMSTIAKEEFPLLGTFLQIPESKHTTAQSAYISKYFMRVNELLPNAMEIIGKETKETLARFKEENGLI